VCVYLVTHGKPFETEYIRFGLYLSVSEFGHT